MDYRVTVKISFVATLEVAELDFEKAARFAVERTLDEVMGVIKEKCGTATSFSGRALEVENLDA